jgi:flagellar basal-body rod protein FlgG
MRALSIAASGMNAQQQNVEVIANNIANINTTAFKRSRAEFTDLMYQAERVQGTIAGGKDNIIPEGAQIGLGVRTAAVRQLHIQGSLNNTSNKLDLAITGRGWFQINSPDGQTLYTRDGSFSLNANSQLVTSDGYTVIPQMTIPQNTTDLNISANGIISATIGGQSTPVQVGQLTLANFVNEAGLIPLGNNLYQQSEASGAPSVGIPTDPGLGQIQQGYLEQSNVDPVKEITELISAQRAYEMNSKIIQAVDDMSSTISKGLR